jgi:N-methylhydantoinase A/oxoprolinase/acetone carboxylase beta subunit
VKRIGIDVGGTNTDAVLIAGSSVLAAVKSPTTEDVLTGVVRSLGELVAAAPDALIGLDAVMIGTTHFTNAVVQRRHLARVAAVRICLPASASLLPMCDWPTDLRDAVDPLVFLVRGGHEYDGRIIAPLDEEAVRAAAAETRAAGVTAAAICSVFSPLTAEHEQEAARIFADEAPEVLVTCSHELGRIGLLERENVALLNACLTHLGRNTVGAFEAALRQAGITAPFYMTQNDGTILRAHVAARFPVFSFASGPTNSMRGAAFLSGLNDAMVVDVGGTTSDIGCLVNGFPREANNVVRIGGVRTLFRMPDLLSLGLGGGTMIALDPLTVGPQSVGHRIRTDAQIFGGSTLTATDVGVAAGLVDLGDVSAVARLEAKDVAAVMGRIRDMLEDGIDRMKSTAADIPLLAVGGGAFLVPRSLAGVSDVIQVPHAGVANAVGAAIAQVSGEADRVVTGMPRDAAIAEVVASARARAIEGGADPRTISIVEVDDLPIAYLPGDALRVRVRVVGDILEPGTADEAAA